MAFVGDPRDDWPLEPGQVIKRSNLHDQFGGSRQSGISPCRVSPNVLIFTDQASGSPHGYVFDGWVDEGGEGETQRPPQRPQTAPHTRSRWRMPPAGSGAQRAPPHPLTTRP